MNQGIQVQNSKLVLRQSNERNKETLKDTMLTDLREEFARHVNRIKRDHFKSYPH